MIINILVCKPNGEQAIELRDVGGDWFPTAEEAAENSGA